MKIAEVFYSLQGEGALTGMPSVFIRFAGCNLRCSWCDTKYASWSPETEPWDIDAILEYVKSCNTSHVVITGGEPTLQHELLELTTELKQLGKHITIESNGTTYRGDIQCDLISLSPKLAHSIANVDEFPEEAKIQSERRINLESLRNWIDNYEYQLKFVVSSFDDIYEIQALVDKLARKIPADHILLMPEGVDSQTILSRSELVVNSCKEFGYRYCYRLHVDFFGSTRGT